MAALFLASVLPLPSMRSALKAMATISTCFVNHLLHMCWLSIQMTPKLVFSVLSFLLVCHSIISTVSRSQATLQVRASEIRHFPPLLSQVSVLISHLLKEMIIFQSLNHKHLETLFSFFLTSHPNQNEDPLRILDNYLWSVQKLQSHPFFLFILEIQ